MGFERIFKYVNFEVKRINLNMLIYSPKITIEGQVHSPSPLIAHLLCDPLPVIFLHPPRKGGIDPPPVERRHPPTQCHFFCFFNVF